eukprot:5899776-Amphidinium_carterae.1
MEFNFTGRKRMSVAQLGQKRIKLEHTSQLFFRGGSFVVVIWTFEGFQTNQISCLPDPSRLDGFMRIGE